MVRLDTKVMVQEEPGETRSTWLAGKICWVSENFWYTVDDCTYDEVTLLSLLLHIFSVIRVPQLIWLPTVQGLHILPNYETTRHKNSNPVFRFDRGLSSGCYQHWQLRYFLSSIITRPVFPWHRVDTERGWGVKNWNIIVWYNIIDQITSSLCPDHLRTMCGLHLVWLQKTTNGAPWLQINLALAYFLIAIKKRSRSKWEKNQLCPRLRSHHHQKMMKIEMKKTNLAPAYFLATIKKWNKSTVNHYHQNGDPESIISEATSKPTAQTKSTSVEFWTLKEGLKMLLVSSEAVGRGHS